MSLLDRLDTWDREVFLAINGVHAPWADWLMVAVSEMLVWLPFYVFLLFLLRRRFGWKGLWWSLPVIALMVWCSDSGSVMLFKNTVQRLRPCHQPELAGLVHTVNERCGGSFGFVSSHASNHFAIAAFMIGALAGTTRSRLREAASGGARWIAPVLLGWAALIAYSRIYLGVHYPGDVLVGGLYGSCVGAIFVVLHRVVLARAGVR